MDETPARTEELPELLRQARALLDRYQRVRADEILAPALPRAGGASERLLHDLHLLACEAAFLRSDYPRAQRHAEQALELARALGQGTLEALALGWAGATLAQQDRYT